MLFKLQPRKSVWEKARRIKLILLDVDGVLTSGGITYGRIHDSDEAVEIKTFNAHDGYGIIRAIENGINVGIITARNSKLVQIRAEELGIKDIRQGSFNKLEGYESIRGEHGLTHEEVSFMGDDLFDLPVLNLVGLSVAPSNARPEVRRKVDFVTRSSGGAGAVRELIDMILKTQGIAYAENDE